LDVLLDLIGQGAGIGKFLFGAKVAMKFQVDLLAKELA
jgi:hypothetical protein